MLIRDVFAGAGARLQAVQGLPNKHGKEEETQIYRSAIFQLGEHCDGNCFELRDAVAVCKEQLRELEARPGISSERVHSAYKFCYDLLRAVSEKAGLGVSGAMIGGPAGLAVQQAVAYNIGEWFGENTKRSINTPAQSATDIVQDFAEATGSGKIALFLYSGRQNELRLLGSKGLADSEQFPWMHTSDTSGLMSQIAHSHGPIALGSGIDPSLESAFPGLAERLKAGGFSNLIPLMGEGSLLGLVALGGSKASVPLERTERAARGAAQRIEDLHLYAASLRDAKIRVFNMKFLMRELEKELLRSRRDEKPCSLLFLDLDHFKNVNDEGNGGHPTGDAVLSEFVDVTHGCLSRGESVSRYGGEEFCVILPETNSKGARSVAEKIRKAVQKHVFRGTVREIPLTVSIGAATIGPEEVSRRASKAEIARIAHGLISVADEQLYKAKHSGRNKVCAVTVSSKTKPFYLGIPRRAKGDLQRV